jgi:hypothetical protein
MGVKMMVAAAGVRKVPITRHTRITLNRNNDL